MVPSAQPADADVLVAAAAEAMSKQTPDTAVSLLEGAVKLDPDNGPAWALLGLARKNVGKVPAAIEAYERAVALDEENVVSAVELAELYSSAGDGPRARALTTWLLTSLDSPPLRRRAEAVLRTLEGAVG